MFQEVSSETVSIQSSWNKETIKRVGSTQTSEIITNEVALQSLLTMDAACQTDKVAAKNQSKLIVDNSAELREFLKRVEPMVIRALNNNLQSYAFDGYRATWEEEVSKLSTVHMLYHPQLSHQFHCTGLSWNSTGSVIAISYGYYRHDSWCTHKTAVCTWSIDKRSVNHKEPDVTVESDTCLMCAEFHPLLPSILAVGAFTGDVRILDIGNQVDPLLVQSGLGDQGHKEPITELSWMPRSKDRDTTYNIVSLSNDGMLWVWSVKSEGSKVINKMEALQTYLLKSSNVPRSLRVAKSNSMSHLGGTSFAFSSEESEVVMVGCENGSVVKCTIDALPAVSATQREPPNPIMHSYKPHQGPVYGLSYSPFHRNLFLTCGCDGTIRLYTALESSPLVSVEPDQGYLFSVSWSPTRPLVFVAGTSQGSLLFYDLKASQVNPIQSINICDKKPLYCIKYNHTRPKLLAVGDATGKVTVLSLNHDLTQQAAKELDYLSSLALNS